MPELRLPRKLENLRRTSNLHKEPKKLLRKLKRELAKEKNG
jgi:hypothetical protein